MTKKHPMLFLGLSTVLLLGTACVPHFMKWPAFKPQAPEDPYLGRQLGYAFCSGGEWYDEIYEWEEYLNDAWEPHLGLSGMNANFVPIGGNCGGYHPGPLINIGYDFDVYDDYGCSPSQFVCNDFHGFQEGDEVQRANVWVTNAWVGLSGTRRAAWAAREIGHLMGLIKMPHPQCLPDPISGLDTVMGEPYLVCGTSFLHTEPQAADVIGVVCWNYDYKCGFNPGPMGAASTGPDGDGDGVEDAVDNCPTMANPGQKDREIDGMGDACDGDDDNDTFSDAAEAYMGTDALDNCPDSSQHDAWPPDFDQNRVVNIVDLNKLLPAPLGSWGATPGNGPYSARRDLVPDGLINILDLNKLLPPPLGFWGQTCVSTDSQIVDVIDATEQYRNFSAAESDGFDQATQYVSGRGSYYVNPSRWNDGEEPELFEPDGLFFDQNKRLMGVVYYAPLALDPIPPEGFIGIEDVWPTRQGFCISENGEPSEGVTEEQCAASGANYYWDEMGHVLIAWLFRHNPDGPFAEVNPNVN